MPYTVPRKLRSIDVREILTTDTPVRALASKFGVSNSLISRIRLGKAYKEVLPELPRQKSRAVVTRLSCSQCVHHIAVPDEDRVLCSLEFPEIHGPMGLRCAAECSAFTGAPA